MSNIQVLLQSLAQNAAILQTGLANVAAIGQNAVQTGVQSAVNFL